MAQNTESVTLGISAYYHDSAAALLVNGQLVAAAQEERFTRIKHDAAFPAKAVEYVLAEANLSLSDVTDVAFYDKPYVKFERLLEIFHLYAPSGWKSFLQAMPVWIKEKLFLKRLIRNELKALAGGKNISCQLLFPEHHLSHAASAFFPSPFQKAATLTIDGVGEWTTTSLGVGSGNELTSLKEIHFPHSLGLLYSAFTYYCGFKVNSGEYKLMGLAPYGDPNSEQTKSYIEKIESSLIDVRHDGSYVLNLDYFEFTTGNTMTNDSKWESLFQLPRLPFESELTQPYMNLALAIQTVTESIVIQLAKTATELAKSKNLVMAGGVALNCVANGKLLSQPWLDHLWIQPAAGDAGGAPGAALAAWHIFKDQPRTVNPKDSMNGAYLGPEFHQEDVNALIKNTRAVAINYEDSGLFKTVAESLKQGDVVGWFQGRMEFGPRALCNRSILADPRNPEMQQTLNLKIKYREGFRPFAPVVTEEYVAEFFDIAVKSPYMLLVAQVKDSLKKVLPENYADMPLFERLYVERSTIPAITHVDGSARIQTVSKDTNLRMHKLLSAFGAITNTPMLINTSFNVRGEPIVCTPDDAYRCFMETEMNILVINNTVFKKNEQPAWEKKIQHFEKD